MEKIAIVGCGISGMTLAKRLQEAGYSVEIFEKESAAGRRLEEFPSRYAHFPVS